MVTMPPTARAMVFVGSEEEARLAAEPLRNALWGAHQLSVLLPHGREPVKVCSLSIITQRRAYRLSVPTL